MQLTFRGNYEACSDDINLDLITDPDRVRTDLTIAALVSGWFRSTNGFNTLADAVPRGINEATAGKTERDALYAAAPHALCIPK